jgi:CRISPR/Cas system CSM-associated protein Csm3 (group 7 of RAMP superfamily)
MRLVTLDLTIEFLSPVHHGSGFGVAGVVDRAVLRDHTGMPYLAGSAIKGKFRFAAGQIARAMDANAELCDPGNNPVGRWCRGQTRCPLCEVFGSPRRAGAAVFCDALPEEDERAILRAQIENSPSVVLSAVAQVRASTAIDRRFRKALTHHLYSTETVPSQVRFHARIEDVPDKQVELLRNCAVLLNSFGGSSSRGLGSCRFVITEAKDDGEDAQP